MFPHALTDRRAFDIAQTMLEGFDRHYRLFRAASAGAKQRFERADWHGQQRAQRERIEYYDKRVNEAVARLRRRTLLCSNLGRAAARFCARSRLARLRLARP